MDPVPPLVGLARFPLARQTDAYSCGAACLRMICDHLEFHPGVGIKEIGRLAGTNPATGTTEVEMARGLDALGLAWERPRGTGTAYLRQVVGAGNVILLCTLLPGGPRRPEGYKHWVVVHGCEADGFRIACPGAGARRWTEGFTHRVWAARDYDHFVVPADRRAHPRALAQERRLRATEWRPVHEMTLREFLRGAPVVPDAKLNRWHREIIREAAEAILLMGASGQGRDMAHDGAPGFLFRAVPRNGSTEDMVVIERGTGRTAGGISRGLRWVHPEFRGRGLGAEIVLAAHSERGREFLNPSSYSEGGYRSRVAAHRLAIERALAAGIPVPARVLSQPGPGTGSAAAVPDRGGTGTAHPATGEGAAPAADDAQLRLF